MPLKCTCAVFREDSISVKAWGAKIARGSGGVIHALEAIAVDAVTGTRILGVDVTRAVARLAVVACMKI